MGNQNQRYPELMKPGRIGHLLLKNRIVLAPMGTYLAGRDGMMTDRMKSYYVERARGGAGLIIVGVASVDYPRGRCMTRQLGLSDDKFIPGLADLAEAVHKHEAKIAIQLQHGGRIAAPFLSGGHEAVSASVIPLVPAELGVTRELTIPEIQQLVTSFALAAERAKNAGIDGVEIHAGHGYLIDQFLSRSTNHRQDAYGGGLENRARFLLEIIRAVRGTVGPQYPVWCRIDGKEFATENGITEQESLEIARLIKNAGVDAVHVSGYGGSYGVHFTDAPLVNIPGLLVPLARSIKEAVNIPVIAVGRIDIDLAESILRQGAADFVAMGRPLLADPELPRKIAGGDIDDIRKCIYCYTCVHQIFVRSGVCCAVNPSVGKEHEPAPQPPSKVKNVIVSGGGPAGMEAARRAALRGHHVTLYESENALGGSLLIASIVRPEKQDLIDYLTDQLKKLDVTVKLGERVTPDLVKKIKPDVLVLASGARRNNPLIPGIDGKNVFNGDDLRLLLRGKLGNEISTRLSFWQKAVLNTGRFFFSPLFRPRYIRSLSRFWMPLGKRVVVLGGGMVGCELADFLAERNRKVTIVEDSDQLAPEMALPAKWIILDMLEKKGVDLITGAKCEEISSGGVSLLNSKGERLNINADTIIVASGTGPDPEIMKEFQDTAPEIYLAGDCHKLGYIKDAVADGARIGDAL
jgi:2,4-dienoyl-CoA reductase-like NADH-dependent reductase (Old Yellow Enzyme family)/thioredoxin reductase